MLLEKKRLDYIDWAKAIGIILIVLGNMMPSGCPPRTLLYSFHVPLFAIIGGILFEAPDNWGVFGKKSFNIVKRLLIPYIIFFAICSAFYLLPAESIPTWISASKPENIKELLKYFVFFERRTIWNATLSFMPCYIVISFVFLLFAKLTKGNRSAAFALGALSFLVLLAMEKKGITIDAFGIKDAFGMKNYFLMLGFFAIGYAIRPMLDACVDMFEKPSKNPFVIASLCAFPMLSFLCLRCNAIEITDKQPAGYYSLSMYSGLYNDMTQFIALALLLSVTLIIALMILPKCNIVNLISRSTLFIMFVHLFVKFDKSFTDIIPYGSMWETDMKVAYRDAASVMVVLIVFLLVFDAIQKKFPKTRHIFTYIGIK